MTIDTQFLVAGAGIAGLTAALALAQRGFDVTIAEAFDEPSEVGAGLQIAPNASRILRRLGVLDALADKALAPSSIRLGDAPSGRILLDMPITEEWLSRIGAPYLTAHRASLHGVLYAAVVANPRVNMMTGLRITDVLENGDGITARFDSGAGAIEIRTAVLVGADGVWSAVRSAVAGAASPKPTGRIAWRAMGPVSTANGAPRVTAWMAPDSHVVAYPVRNSDTLNIVAITSGEAKAGSWAQEGEGSVLLDFLDGMSTATRLDEFHNVDWNIWPLNSVAPSGSWNTGRILLIGDAAHGMEPFAAQGAAMAIEDGYAAGLCIARNPDHPRAAFSHYRALRYPRVRRVANRTAFNRWVYHQDGVGRTTRNFFFSNRSPQSFLADLDWLYGYRLPE